MLRQYTEPLEKSDSIRQLYAQSVDNAVDTIRKWATDKREARITPEKMASDREGFRKEYARLLGIDVCCEVFGESVPECEISPVGEDELTLIERMKVKIADGVYFTGLLLTPHKRDKKAPLVVMSHGGGGSPELCCDMAGQNNYSDVVRKLLAKGIIVFAHQLLLWRLDPVLCESEVPQYRAAYDRWKSDNAMKHCGTSIAAFEIYCICRTLDYLLGKDNVNADKCGMLGLSYGGFYTHYTMAYEKRIKVGFAAAFFNDRIKYDWQDVVWKGSVTSFLDSEVAGLCAPRKFIVDIGKTDTVFDYTGGEAQRERVHKFFEAADAEENLRFNVWDGEHRFSMESFDVFVNWLNEI